MEQLKRWVEEPHNCEICDVGKTRKTIRDKTAQLAIVQYCTKGRIRKLGLRLTNNIIGQHKQLSKNLIVAYLSALLTVNLHSLSDCINFCDCANYFNPLCPRPRMDSGVAAGRERTSARHPPVRVPSAAFAERARR